MTSFLTYSQTHGEIIQHDVDDDGADQITILGIGWAGRGEGKNNPSMQDIHSTGPLPRTWYTVDPWEAEHGHLGPMVAHLTPDPGSEMFGRDGFYIHGASSNPDNYGQESMGCIVLTHDSRLKVKVSGLTRLQVIE